MEISVAGHFEFTLIITIFSQVGTLVNSSFGNEYIWFLKNARYLE